MWELQPLSNNRRTTEISLLLGENTSLTFSQIPHNFMGLLSLHSLYLLSIFSLVVCKISLDALPIYRQAFKQRTKGHQLVLQVAPNWCPTLLTLPTMLAGFTYFTFNHWWNWGLIIMPQQYVDLPIISFLVGFRGRWGLYGISSICMLKVGFLVLYIHNWWHAWAMLISK
jgi:hypothetical protein